MKRTIGLVVLTLIAVSAIGRAAVGEAQSPPPPAFIIQALAASSEQPPAAVFHGAADALAPAPSGSRQRIPSTDPVSKPLVFLAIVNSENDSVSCSGAIIGKATILTAAHCVYGAKSVYVLAGKDGSSEPFEGVYASHIAVPQEWGYTAPAEEQKHDIGLVILRADSNLTTKTGIFPGKLAALPAGAFALGATQVAALGYPGDCSNSSCGSSVPDSPTKGTWQWALHAGFASADEALIYPDFAGSPGLSGGPIIRESDLAIVGVVTQKLLAFSQGVRINRATLDFISDVCARFPQCEVGTPLKLYTRPAAALSMDSPSIPVLTGKALYCSREVTYVNGVTNEFIALRDSLLVIMDTDITTINPFDPAIKDRFTGLAVTGVQHMLALKALQPPDARFATFDTELDAAVDSGLAALVSLNSLLQGGDPTAILSALLSLSQAQQHFAAAESAYPGIDDSCVS